MLRTKDQCGSETLLLRLDQGLEVLAGPGRRGIGKQSPIVVAFIGHTFDLNELASAPGVAQLEIKATILERRFTLNTLKT